MFVEHAKALPVRNRFGCQSIAPGWFDSHSGALVTRENRDMSNPSGTACQPCVSSLFDRTKMPILTISSALPLRPFCNLAVDWTDVRNDWPTRPGKENEKHRRKQLWWFSVKMESGRSKLASIWPFRRSSLDGTAAAETATGFEEKSGWLVPRCIAH